MNLALRLCRGYATAQANTLYDYLQSARKIVRVRSDDGAVYGEKEYIFFFWVDLPIPSFYDFRSDHHEPVVVPYSFTEYFDLLWFKV